jgi:outer membrane protein OmpA-like peptidoglycan-associated protein
VRVVLGGALSILLASPASADRFEASGFIGVGVFTENTELGNSWATEQVPNTAPVIGGRLGWLAVPHLGHFGEGAHLALAFEAELSLATAFTGGYTGDVGRMSYFAPVFGWRGHAMLRLAGSTVAPHLVLGAGGETIASSSPFMSKETDPVAYWGPGVSIAISNHWRVRVDVRHGVMAARDDGMTSTLEVQLGVGAVFGATPKRARTTPRVEVAVTSDPDSDGDGVPDRRDLCPDASGTHHTDGCAAPDPDGDGILANDACPNQAEDFDGFQDDDGCPDPDNDGDGIEDTRDACPNEPETKNGVDDHDGCPDSVPDNITRALATAKVVKFEANRARVTAAASATLKPLHLMMLAHPDVAITITGLPEQAGGDDLAKRRAEAVKWHLVDQGITESRIFTAIGGVAAPNKPVIELSLRTK